ncbi:MAG: flagellar biosynthetic protein FliO [Phycisphaerales bacterium]
MANPLRATEIQPVSPVAPQQTTNNASSPVVEYGPAMPQAERPTEASVAAPQTQAPVAQPTTQSGVERKPLGEPGAARLGEANQDTRPLRREASAEAKSSGGLGLTSGASRTVGALAAVVGLILVVRWFVRRMSQRVGGLAGQLGAGGRAPSGVLEVLGRYPVGKGQSLVLLRLDRRVLLLSQSSQGFATLTEIEDPQEVASLVVKTADDESASLAARFRSILSSFERDPSLAGEVETVDAGGPTTLRLARQRRAEVIEVTDTQAAKLSPVASVRRRLALLRSDEEAA